MTEVAELGDRHVVTATFLDPSEDSVNAAINSKYCFMSEHHANEKVSLTLLKTID